MVWVCGGGLSINVTHGVQLSGVSVTFESVLFVGNAAICLGTGCGTSDDDDTPTVVAIRSGAGASILIEAPIVSDTSITLNNCQLLNNVATPLSCTMMVFV